MTTIKLTPFQQAILDVIPADGRPITQRDIGIQADVHANSVKLGLDALVAKGLISLVHPHKTAGSRKWGRCGL